MTTESRETVRTPKQRTRSAGKSIADSDIDDGAVEQRPARSKARQTGDGNAALDWENLETDNQFVKALGRGLEILSAFKAGDGPLGNTELAERTGLPTATVSRITYTLAKCGFLTFNRRLRMYELGGEAFAIGRVALANFDVRRMARPFMRDLAEQSGFNVGLGTRDRHSMIYTDACEGASLVGLRLFAGSRIPIGTSAMGRAYLAGLPEDELIPLLNELKPRYQNWGEVYKSIEQARQEVEQYGFCVSLGEWQPDIHGVAAPIRTPEGDKMFAVNLGGPSYALPAEAIWSSHGPAIADLAHQVEKLMAV
ncbi:MULTISPECIES: IclR family transcriptional regulator [unclassified Chelatococcus]|uniref:IclR family transcriptional regulator n=1 Tax=unclassified Chelatococcus TaxID=2638111 RepID=UPI001BCCB596|nr:MULTISPECIES: IclR family transcriptional regulator [unclassified Chelatococcus]MBS7700176.1 IclR family transcriptional regulator [Chelatococcus sp. YT9]MBX3556869.1 IclR family transcriptional regulator [Chelatococcus sp.]